MCVYVVFFKKGMVVCGLVFEFLSKFFNFLQKGLALLG